jgi:TPR repeat protein
MKVSLPLDAIIGMLISLAVGEIFSADQTNYGLCLQSGESVPQDFRGTAQCLKLAADEGLDVA